MKIRNPVSNEDSPRSPDANETSWPFNSDETKQRVERFFETNEMKFRSIIDEHRKFQSNQRKRSQCNHMCCLSNPRMCKMNQSHSFDGSLVTRANSTLATYGYHVQGGGEATTPTKGGSSSGRTLPTPKHPQRRISHHGFLLAAAATQGGLSGDIGAHIASIPLVRSKSIVHDSSGVIYHHPIAPDQMKNPIDVKLAVAGSPILRSNSFINNTAPTANTAPQTSTAPQKMLPQFPVNHRNSFEHNTTTVIFPLLRSNSYANDSNNAAESQTRPSYSHGTETNTRPTSFSNASDYSTNKPGSLPWHKNSESKPFLFKPPEIKIHKPDSDPDSSPEISKKKMTNRFQSVAKATVAIHKPSLVTIPKATATIPETTPKVTSSPKTKPPVQSPSTDNQFKMSNGREQAGKPTQTKVQQIVSMFSEPKKTTFSPPPVVKKSKPDAIISKTVKCFTAKLNNNAATNGPNNSIAKKSVNKSIPSQKTQESPKTSPKPVRSSAEKLPINNKLVDSPLVNCSVTRSLSNVDNNAEEANKPIFTNTARKEGSGDLPTVKVMNKIEEKSVENFTENGKTANGPIFNNSFGIWALERRIEEDLKEQQARKQLQRTSSLDQNNLLTPKRGILKNTIKGSSSFSDHKSFLIEQVSTNTDTFSDDLDASPSVHSLESVKSVENDSTSFLPLEIIPEKQDLTVTNNLNRSNSTTSQKASRRPPLVRQNFVADEEDELNQDLFYLGQQPSNIPQFFVTDSEDGTKEEDDDDEVTPRESIVTFNDVVVYKTLSSEDVEDEVLHVSDEEVQSFMRDLHYATSNGGIGDGPEILDDPEERAKCFEIENNKNKESKKDSQEEAKDNRRQRLKDITTWRRVSCDESQDCENKELDDEGGGGGGEEGGGREGRREELRSGGSDSGNGYLSRGSVIDEDTSDREPNRSQVQRTRPGRVKRCKKVSSELNLNEPKKDDVEDGMTTATSPPPPPSLSHLSTNSETDGSLLLSNGVLGGSKESSFSTSMGGGGSKELSMSSSTSSYSTTNKSTSTESSQQSMDKGDLKLPKGIINNRKLELTTRVSGSAKLGKHTVRILAPTSSDDHTHSSDDPPRLAALNSPVSEPEAHQTKQKRVRKPFNLPRVSSDSIDEVFNPATPRSFNGGKKSSSSSFIQSPTFTPGLFPKKGRNKSLKLGNHRVTIESPTSSEADNASATDEDYTTTSVKSSLSEPEEHKHRISLATSYEWLTDNEGYYEDCLDVAKLEDKYNKKRGNELNNKPQNDASSGKHLLRASQSFTSAGASNTHTRLHRTASLKKFNSEGDICGIGVRSGDMSKVQMTVCELFETERNYTTNLLTIMEVFAQPIKEIGLLTRKVHSTLFPSQLIRLLHKHSVLLGRLEERLNNWHELQRVGDLFSVFEEHTTDGLFKVYLNYITHFPLLFAKLAKVTETNERFRNFIQRCREDEPVCQRLSLLSFLYNPIQRLPQYLMLLRNYTKHLSINHSDWQSIKSALNSLDRLLFIANKLCNFRKDGPGAIKLPTSSATRSASSVSYPNISSHGGSTSSVASTRPQTRKASSTEKNSSENGTPPHSANEKKPSSYQRKLSTVLNVLTFSNVIKKRKNGRTARA